MRLSLMLGAAAACALATAASGAPTGGAAPADPSALSDALRQAAIATQDNDLTGARTTVERVIGAPGFAKLSAEQRHGAILLDAIILGGLHDDRASLERLRAASEMEGAGEYDWTMRLDTAWRLHDLQEAAVSLTGLTRLAPDKLAGIDDTSILQLSREAGLANDHGETQFQLLRALYQAHWRPKAARIPVDYLWFQLAVRWLDRGDAAHGAEVARSITAADVMVRLLDDRRFDEIVAANRDRFDVDAAAAREIAELRRRAAAEPDQLQVVIALADALLDDNRPRESLQVIDQALARIRASDAGAPAYEDQADQLNWLFNDRAGALAAVGQSADEAPKPKGSPAAPATSTAIDDMTHAARLPERGALNVSQAINLGGYFLAARRPQDALNSVARVDLALVSSYGRVALEEVRACAYARLGQKDAARQSFDFIKAHQREGVWLYRAALQCADYQDELAQTYIADLENPETRSDALLEFQNFGPDEDEAHASASRKVQLAEWHALLARPDIQAAINKVGRINHYSIRQPRRG